MPRTVDHAERRRQITDATRRVVVQHGLDGATFQAVAAEAGVSVRLVQYYFGDKAGLLAATHRAVIEDSAARFAPRPRQAGGLAEAARVGVPVRADGPPSDREMLRGVMTALLPLDPASRDDAVVLAAFHAAALAHGDVAAEGLLGAPRALVELLAAQLDTEPGSAVPGSDVPGGAGAGDAERGARLDAEILLATAAGLTQAVLAGHHDPSTALAVVDRLLDRLLGAAGVS